jgi:hypothetical protein
MEESIHQARWLLFIIFALTVGMTTLGALAS